MDDGAGRANYRRRILWHMLPVAAALIWGSLCMTDQLWYDEAYSAGLVMKPWREMIYITAADDHSPFYYACLKLFYCLCGGGTRFRTLKWFSLLFMLGYMLLGKYYVAKLFDQRISVWFMLFSLAAPIMTVQAGNVRMYAQALFFMTLTGLLAYDIYREESRGKWMLFTFSSVCAVYCHTFAMLLAVWLYLIFLAALFRSGQYRKLKKCVLSGAVVSAVFSPWLFVTFLQMRRRMKYDLGSVEELADWRALADYCREWFSAAETPIEPVVWLGLALFAILSALAVLWMRRERCFAPALGAAAFGLTALTGFLISAFVDNCFMGRYVFPGFGAVMLLYAVGFTQIKPLWAKGAVLAAAALCFVMQFQSELSLEYDKGLEAYETFWREQVGAQDAVMGRGAEGHTIFLSVYHPEADYYLEGYVPRELAFPNLRDCYDVPRLCGELAENGGTLWYIAFADSGLTDVAKLPVKEAARFHYMYYDFVIYRVQFTQ